MPLLSTKFESHVATITIESPTMPPAFFRELKDCFLAIAQKKELRAIVLQSDADGFSYGLDLPTTAKEHGELLSGGGAAVRTKLHQLILRYQDALNQVSQCPVPVIAAIHGPCIGGGVDLITCCDIRVASEDAVFSVRETQIAIVADLGTLQRLPRIVGKGHARELALTGRNINANRAVNIGLVNDVYDDAQATKLAARRMANEIAANPPLTVRGVKNVLNFTEAHGTQAGLAYVAAWNAAFLASDDLDEAMAAFMTKRPPKFEGR